MIELYRHVTDDMVAVVVYDDGDEDPRANAFTTRGLRNIGTETGAKPSPSLVDGWCGFGRGWRVKSCTPLITTEGKD